MGFRVGIGYDVHELVTGRKLILGGVDIKHDKGLLGHSDADVLIHAVMDSIIGAMGLGDIGRHFPDTSSKYKDIDSRYLLREVKKIMDSQSYYVVNIDAVIAAQKPKLAEFIPEMVKNIADDLNCDISQINIKATTTEKLGFEGREEGISSQAIVMIEKL